MSGPGAAARRRLRAQGGFTLVEMLMALLIGSIVLGAAMNIFMAGQRSSTRVQDRAESVQRGRVVME
ncbi:MAG: prepilin-type N-terminal cleavage/methylation domain-containing protein, partial [Solirubrobacteraceae bacterium]